MSQAQIELSGDYSGTDNLEAMTAAVNYNSFLSELVHKHAKKGTAIDHGAGIGTFAKECASAGIDVHCVEPCINQARGLETLGFNVSLSLSELPDEDADLLYSLNVLEHIEDDDAMLREAFQKLKPGGRILVYVPAFQMLYSSMDRKVGHYRRYTRCELGEKLSNAGFKVMKSRYADSLGFLVSLLYKYAGPDSGAITKQSVLIYDRIIFPVSRALDFVFGRLFGKNVYSVAVKPFCDSKFQQGCP